MTSRVRLPLASMTEIPTKRGSPARPARSRARRVRRPRAGPRLRCCMLRCSQLLAVVACLLALPTAADPADGALALARALFRLWRVCTLRLLTWHVSPAAAAAAAEFFGLARESVAGAAPLRCASGPCGVVTRLERTLEGCARRHSRPHSAAAASLARAATQHGLSPPPGHARGRLLAARRGGRCRLHARAAGVAPRRRLCGRVRARGSGAQGHGCVSRVGEHPARCCA